MLDVAALPRLAASIGYPACRVVAGSERGIDPAMVADMGRSALGMLVMVLFAARAHAQDHIFQPGTQPIGEAGGIQVPVQGSRSCDACHGGYGGPDDDYGANDSWRGSLMGNAARDPVVRAALAIAEVDHPAAADFCLRCHAPTAWLAGRSSLREYDPSNPGYPERLRPDVPTDDFRTGSFSADLDGVGCMICHRMIDPGDPELLGNARFVLADGDQGNMRRGPYEYAPDQDPRHETAFEPFQSESAFCGTCHDISNPLLTGHRGTESTGRPMAIERTYSEWLNSAFATGAEAKTCQDCHLPEVSADASLEGFFRETMSRHDLNGGNVWVPLALAESASAVSEEAARLLKRSSERANRSLNEAATLEIRDFMFDGSEAAATIRVTNETGHKLPTGYPEGRRMWLEVTIRDVSGVRWRSGVLSDGSLVTDDQLRTYEVKLGQNGEEGFHFVLNDSLIADTRIPPRGFRLRDPVSESEMAPLGRDYRNDDGSYRHWDEASYSMRGICGEGTLTLTARLLFQTTTREYIEFLRDNQPPPSGDPALGGRTWGRIAYDAWQRHGGDQAIEMERVEVTLGAARACPDAGLPAPDAGVSDAAGTAADAAIPEQPHGAGCSVGSRTRIPRPSAWLALVGSAMAMLGAVRRRRPRSRGSL